MDNLVIRLIIVYTKTLLIKYYPIRYVEQIGKLMILSPLHFQDQPLYLEKSIGFLE